MSRRCRCHVSHSTDVFALIGHRSARDWSDVDTFTVTQNLAALGACRSTTVTHVIQTLAFVGTRKGLGIRSRAAASALRL